MARSSLYCSECGARLSLYVVGICEQCAFDLPGTDPERDERERRASGGRVSDPEGTEA